MSALFVAAKYITLVEWILVKISSQTSFFNQSSWNKLKDNVFKLFKFRLFEEKKNQLHKFSYSGPLKLKFLSKSSLWI